MNNYLTQSLFVVITGAVGAGKTEQIHSLLKAKVDDECIATPTLYILAEDSAWGTAGEVLLDPSRSVVWPAADCEQARKAVDACFPDSGPVTLGEAKAKMYKAAVELSVVEERRPPPPPDASPNDHVTMRSVVADTASTLYKGSVVTGLRKLEAETKAENRGRAGKKDAPYNDARMGHGYAARVCGDFIDRLNRASMSHRGLITMVTVHTGPAVVSISGGPGEPTQDVVCGEAPMLGSTKKVQAGLCVPGFSVTWNALAAKANVIWHAFASVPDMANVRLADLNAFAAANPSKHGVVTRRGSYPGLGQIMWVKSQGGEGPLGIFTQLPAMWHPDAAPDGVPGISVGPDLGKVVAYAMQSYRDEQRAAAQ